MTVLGFGTCIALGTASGSAPDATGDRIAADCNTGVHIYHSNAPFFSDTKVTPDLTGGPYRLWTIEKKSKPPPAVTVGECRSAKDDRSGRTR